jgi:hypothetical protein
MGGKNAAYGGSTSKTGAVKGTARCQDIPDCGHGFRPSGFPLPREGNQVEVKLQDKPRR